MSKNLPLQRFVYLVVDGEKPCTLDLHRIDMSRFFNPRSLQTSAIVEGRLPRPSMTFYAPSSEHCSGSMHFVLLDHDKVLASDQTGRTTIYHVGLRAVSAAPALSGEARDSPVSIAVGDSIYILDAARKEHHLEALVYERGRGRGRWRGRLYDDDWCCQSVPAPPYRPANIGACAVVGGSHLWVSAGDEGTYSLDTAQGGQGVAEYVPEHGLWFGLSAKNGGGNSNLFCAFNLAGAARRQSRPAPRNAWEDLWPPRGWLPVASHLVHLGAARFCMARLFCEKHTERCGCGGMDGYLPWKSFAVFTGVEVEPCGKAGKGLRMVRHRSECYRLGDDNL
ncbi:hypothetical protein SETIT_9G307200v2 [Setaria italica]|uniref:Uncharacterized protein n=1 Tax=Setaria italica TaxID=4555 RepID=K4AIH6_SETIT|nr:hypothetical protein SETIT_9G307200v2 [Setaria italica]